MTEPTEPEAPADSPQDLAAALDAAGVACTPDALRQLLAGIAAAPVADQPGVWMPLFGSDLPAGLRGRLVRAVGAVEADGGLARGRRASGERLAALRGELDRRELDGFVVPLADPHQLEAPPRRDQRLTWLTGFTGSAGLAVVLRERAAIFVDGRYTLQADKEVDTALFERRHLTEDPPDDWIAEHLAGGALGLDPWLHPPEARERFERAVQRAGGRLVSCDGNPVDAVWPDQPAAPLTPAAPHPLESAGADSEDKRARVAGTLARAGQAAAVLTLPDSICWLLNLRGRDVAHTPLVLSFAVLHADASVDWFVDSRKLTPELRRALDRGVRVLAPERLGPELDALAGRGGTLRLDPASAPVWLADRIAAAGGRIARDSEPCQRPKACKNRVELDNSRAAHLRDGLALTRFLAWLADTALARARAGRPVTELEALQALTAFRRADPLYRDDAFDCISAAGEHGAIVHYRVSRTSNRPLLEGELYLCDSGAQYPDGTTDVTRVVPVGAPTAEMVTRYTLVLKGHIALALARFPEGTTGSQLDALARRPLWSVGLDYDHGTGHGVGSYLGVHEGPQRISKRPSTVPLEPGMICSNEPGYYKTGAYGIRIENLVAVTELPGHPDGAKRMRGFETLTLAPYCRALIDSELLTPEEIAWVDAYHSRVRATLTPLLDAETAAWLDRETAPLER